MHLVRRYAPFAVPALVLGLLVLLTPVAATAHRPGSTAVLSTAGGPTPAGVPATGGDRKHCVNGRQFAELPTAPPCEPVWTAPNGGATSAGVTGRTIEIVDYHDGDDALLSSITSKLGVGGSAADEQAFMTVAQRFVNAKYELWGRKVKIDIYHGTCSQLTPDPGCFAREAKVVVGKYHPFGVVYEDDTDAPEFFQALSALGVVNLGGYGFPAAYDVAQRPFHYDVFTDGDAQAELAGSYWCRRLAGRPARFAGSADLRKTTRKAAIIAEGSAMAQSSARRLQSVIDGCDKGGAVLAPYSPDTTTVIAQATTQIALLRREGVTDLLWFSDGVTPVFYTPQLTKQQFFPENVLVGGSLLDNDVFAQLYDPLQWAHAFGPGDSIPSTPVGTQDAGAVWRATGTPGGPKVEDTLTWEYLSLVADGLQQAGPTLTPASFERGLLTLPPTGGGTDSGHPLVTFGPGDYTAISDAREVYWSPTRTSPSDGRPGTYVDLDGGRRFTAGQWPTGDPPLPPPG